MIRHHFLSGAAAVAVSAALPALRHTGDYLPLAFDYYVWDDHYFMALPDHPVFESFEIMTIDRGAGPPLAFAFFTEREAPKRQHRYFNDRRFARNGASYADITVEAGPLKTGVPRAIDLRFTAKDGHVRFRCAFPAIARSMRPAGLTDQSGHGRGLYTLYFYRERAAETADASLTIDGAAVRAGRSREGAVVYSQGILTGIVPFGTFPIARRPETFEVAGASMTLSADGRGIEACENRSYGHAMSVRFGDRLRPSPMTTTYHVALESHRSVASGGVEVDTHGGVVTTTFRPQRPAWTSSYGFVAKSVPGARSITIAAL